MEELTLFDVLPIARLVKSINSCEASCNGLSVTLSFGVKPKNFIAIGLRFNGRKEINQFTPDGILLAERWLVESAIYKRLDTLVKEHLCDVVAFYNENGKIKEKEITGLFYNFTYEEILGMVQALYLYHHTADFDYVKERLNLSKDKLAWLKRIKDYAEITPNIMGAVVDSDCDGKAELDKLNVLALEKKLGEPLDEEKKKIYLKVLGKKALSKIIAGRELGDFLPLFKAEHYRPIFKGGSFYPANPGEKPIGWVFFPFNEGEMFVSNLNGAEELLNEFLKDYELIQNFRNSPLEYLTNLSFVPNKVYRKFEKLSIKYGLKEVSAKAFGVNLVEDFDVDLLPDSKVKRLIKEGVFYRKRIPQFGWLPDVISFKKQGTRLADLLYLYHEGMAYLPFVMLDDKKYVLSKEQIDQIELLFRERAYKKGREIERAILNEGVRSKYELLQEMEALLNRLSHIVVGIWEKSEGIDEIRSVIVAVPRRDTYHNRLSREEVKAIVNDLKGDFSYGFDYFFVKVPIEVYREGLNFSDYSVVGLENEKGEIYYVKPADRRVLEAELTGGVKQL